MPEWRTGETANLIDTINTLESRVADLQRLQLEDRGWNRLGETSDGLTHEWRCNIADLCRVSAITNPLIKRGLGLKAGYVWGQGVTVTVDDDGEDVDGSQDVAAVIDAFWNDPTNRATLTSSAAQVQLENQLGTDGEVFIARPTNLKGRVRARLLPPHEVTEIITDPEDVATRWYYLRTFDQHDPFTGVTTTKHQAYPELGYWPKQRPTSITVNGAPFEVRWSSPVRAVQVNMQTRFDRGIPDAFAAVEWARMSKEFLIDWAKLMRSLSRVAWQVSTRGDKAQQAARQIAVTAGVPGNRDAVGSVVGTDANTRLEAVSKSGATIDANSGLPLQQMVATAFGVPLTMLTGDPGSTGARAVAETLDQPTEHEMGLRRELWSDVIRDICSYVIDQAVIATTGPLSGTVQDDPDDNRRIVTLPDQDGRDIRVDWPEWDSVSLTEQVAALVQVASTELMPPIEMVKLLGAALGVEDIDALVDEVTDEDGNFVPQTVRDQQQFDQQFNQGSFGLPAPEDDPEDDDEVGAQSNR